MRDFSNIPPWSPCEELHTEQQPRIERAIRLAARMLAFEYTDRAVVTVLMADGLTTGEAFNAAQAGAILNKETHDERR